MRLSAAIAVSAFLASACAAPSAADVLDPFDPAARVASRPEGFVPEPPAPPPSPAVSTAAPTAGKAAESGVKIHMTITELPAAAAPVS